MGGDLGELNRTVGDFGVSMRYHGIMVIMIIIMGNYGYIMVIIMVMIMVI